MDVLTVGQLSSGEQYWHDHFEWLADSGYTLRPRYDPEWVPSWGKDLQRAQEHGRSVCINKYPDGIPLAHDCVIDAVRLSDKRPVYLKRVVPPEATIANHLSVEPLASDDRNHAAPVLDILTAPEGDAVILVLPFLRAFDDPPFTTVGEALDAVRQIFEGIAFLHEHGIAHGNLTADNVMFDPTALYPALYHPVSTARNAALTGPAKHATRTLHPPRYFLIDFAHAQRFDGPPVLTASPDSGAEKAPSPSAHDEALAADVRAAGELVRTRLLDRYRGLEQLAPLIKTMVQDDMLAQPLMRDALAQLSTLLSALSVSQLRAYLRPAQQGALAAACARCRHAVRTLLYVARRVPPVPARDGARRLRGKGVTPA